MRWKTIGMVVVVIGTMMAGTTLAGLFNTPVGSARTIAPPGQMAPFVICCGGGGGGGTQDFEVTFTESGLPSGTNWSVNWNGQGTIPTDGTSLSFYEDNGSYNYTVGLPAGYVARPASGLVIVNGAAVTEPITFLATNYEVEFTESGLTTGTAWWVALNGATLVESTSSVLMIPEPSGHYDYQVYPPENYTGNTVYWTNSPTGTVVVNGAPPAPLSITFYPKTFSITFTETGLAKGANWGVDQWNGTWNETYYSTTKSIVFDGLFNGTYASQYFAPAGYTGPAYGNVTISNKSVTVPLGFTESGGNVIRAGPAESTSAAGPVAGTEIAPSGGLGVREMPCCNHGNQPDYEVYFNETGLAPGTNWSVNFAGDLIYGNTSSLFDFDFNGTYNFTAQTFAGYTSRPVSGEVVIYGAIASVTIAYLPTLYEVSFTGTGQGSGTPWWAALSGGTLVESTTSTLMIPSTSGDLSFRIYPPVNFTASELFYASPSSGSVTVSGAPAAGPSIAFTSKVWTITFSEKGLASGKSWSVTLDNSTSWTRTIATTGGSISFGGLFNTTYDYVVHPPSGYSVAPSSGNQAVNGGNPATIKETFTS